MTEILVLVLRITDVAIYCLTTVCWELMSL